MKLRWYQEQAVAAVWDYLRTQDGAPCVVLPTGSGKTPVIAELSRQVVEWGGRVLILAHVKELLEQAVDKISRFVDPSLVGVYSAGLGERTTTTPIVVAGIQSVASRPEALGEFHLLIVDEAHLIPPTGCGRYRQLIEAERSISPNARLVGLTATPYRMGCGWITRDRAGRDDDEKYDRILDSIVYEVAVDKLIADGTLSTVISKRATKSPDFSGVHVKRGDYDETEIERVLNGRGVLELACQEIVKETANRHKVVVFCNRRESARRCAELLAKYDEHNEAAVVDGETSAGDRADLVRRFKSETGDATLIGEGRPLKYICNVGVLTTGFDAPNVDCVVMLRPTQSLALYQQIVGRGLRRSPDKTDCLVLDYGGNVERLGPIDLPVVDDNDRKKKGRGWKTCAACCAIVAACYPTCPICGAKFEIEHRARAIDPSRGLNGRASNAAILSSQRDDDPEQEPIVEEYDVLGVSYSAHYKRKRDESEPDKPPTLQIEYTVSRFGRPLREWLCPEHNGWARKKFEKWWRDRSNTEPPRAAETAAAWASFGALSKPLRIRATTKPGENFPRIDWIESSEIPTSFNPKTVVDDVIDDDFATEFAEFSAFDPDAQRDDGRLVCEGCRSFEPDDQNDKLGFCVRFARDVETTTDACPAYEEPQPDEELPF